MNTFINSGFHQPTLTTTDDPKLKVLEIDNGLSWTINFYVGLELIDSINMEHPIGSEIHNSIKQLPVYFEHDVDDYRVIGTVEERLAHAIDLHTELHNCPYINTNRGIEPEDFEWSIGE